MSPLFFFLLALFLFPVAIYCTVLGMINRRPRPLMMAGTWDFLGVLLATSGFLLFIGPALLSGAFRHSLRELPLQRDGPSMGSAIADIWASWWVFWLLYYLFILGGAAVLIWFRRGTTVIYNIDPPVLDEALNRVAERAGLEITRRGNRVYFAPTSHEAQSAISEIAGTTSISSVQQSRTAISAIVDVEPFALLSNVSLHWRHTLPAARAELERELAKALSEVFIVDNVAGAWLLGVAGFLFLLVIGLTAIFIAIMLPPSRRL